MTEDLIKGVWIALRGAKGGRETTMPTGSGGEHPLHRLRERFVCPGERLAVEEEFLSGRGTYSEKGVIRSEELGKALYDLKRREVNVSKATREALYPCEGLEVIGEVASVQRRMANVDVFMISGREASRPYTGVIYPSASTSYSRSLDLAVRGGDIIRGRIVNTKNRVLQISIEGEEYGVILAYCSKCGSQLEYRRTRLHCPRCGRVDRRKVAKLYGLEVAD